MFSDVWMCVIFVLCMRVMRDVCDMRLMCDRKRVLCACGLIREIFTLMFA